MKLKKHSRIYISVNEYYSEEAKASVLAEEARLRGLGYCVFSPTTAHNITKAMMWEKEKREPTKKELLDSQLRVLMECDLVVDMGLTNNPLDKIYCEQSGIQYIDSRTLEDADD